MKTLRPGVAAFFAGIALAAGLACERPNGEGESRMGQHRVTETGGKRELAPSERESGDGPCQDSDGIRELPSRMVEFCVDPHRDVRRFGPGAPAPLDAACQTYLGEDCGLWSSAGFESLKALTYVPKDASAREVEVTLYEFSRTWGAFAFYTQRVHSAFESKQVSEVEVPGRAVLGVGRALIWRGQRVVELAYRSDFETPREIERRGAAELIPMARIVAEALGGQVEDPAMVRALPSRGRRSVELQADGLLGLPGSGPHALALYHEQDLRYRLVAALRDDQAAARDLLVLLRRSGLSEKLDNRDVFRVRHTQRDQLPQTWYFRRDGRMVFGVGPPASSASADLLTPEQREARGEEWQSFAVRTLLELSAP